MSRLETHQTIVKFRLPAVNDIERQFCDGDSKTIRLQRAALSLVINKKMSSPTSEALYNEIVAVCKRKHVTMSEVVELEERVKQVVAVSRSKIEVFGGCLKESPSQSNFTLKMRLRVRHLRQQDTANEQLSPEIHVFFSKHVSPDSRRSLVIDGNHGAESTIEFVVPCISRAIDGQFAVVRFLFYASFNPRAEDGHKQPYTRRRPFYNGFIHLTELANGKRISLKDSCLKPIDGGLERDPSSHIEIEIIEYSSSGIDFSRRFDESLRRKEIEMANGLTERIYDFLGRERPRVDVLRKTHVIRWPCNMHDILLPGSFFLMDLPENCPPEELLLHALAMNDMTAKEFCDIVEMQFSQSLNLSAQFHRACIVAWRAISTFSYMCEYTADVCYDELRKKLKDVERFVDVFYTLAGDCECSFKAIIAQYHAWCELSLEGASPAVVSFVRILRLFVCTAMIGTAHSAAASANKQGMSDEQLMCHFWGAAVPWCIFAKWTGVEYTPAHEWEKQLFPWILEATSDCHPSARPLHELCDVNRVPLVKKELLEYNERRMALSQHYTSLVRELSGIGWSTINRTQAIAEDFYVHINTIWAPYEIMKLGHSSVIFELYERGHSEYGVPIRVAMYEPERVVAKASLVCLPEELDLCLETVKQQWPIVMPSPCVAPSVPLLDTLARDFFISDADIGTLLQKSSGFVPPYIRFYARHPSVITETLCLTIRTILKNRYLGIFALRYTYLLLELGMKRGEYAHLVDIRLYY
jgi:hypothetical protein